MILPSSSTASSSIAALAALAGLFVVLDARAGDARLTLAGFRTGVLLAARLAVIAAAVLLVTAVSLAATATEFHARQRVLYAGASVLLAVTYGLLGVCLGPIFGRLGGVFVAFLVPALDIGIMQDPMVTPSPPAWAHVLPGYGASRLVFEGGFTTTFTDTGSLLVALAWLGGLAILAGWLFGRGRPRRTILAAG